MKDELKIVGASILFVLAISVFIFQMTSGDFGLTGLVVLDDLVENDSVAEVSLNDVLSAFENIDEIILEMNLNNLSVDYINDVLIEMERVFEQVSFAEILRSDVSYADKAEARSVLRLVDWEDLDYADVIIYYDDIVAQRDLAFLLLDEIAIEDANLDGVSEGNLEILNDAKVAFRAGRYNETGVLLDEFRVSVEKEASEKTVLAGIQRGTRNFFTRYWLFILIFLIILGIIIIFSRKKIKKKLLKKKIAKMETELGVLNGLMKRAQIDRFKKDSISGLVYNIRMKKYNERAGVIREELPVLKARLSGGKVKK